MPRWVVVLSSAAWADGGVKAVEQVGSSFALGVVALLAAVGWGLRVSGTATSRGVRLVLSFVGVMVALLPASSSSLLRFAGWGALVFFAWLAFGAIRPSTPPDDAA